MQRIACLTGRAAAWKPADQRRLWAAISIEATRRCTVCSDTQWLINRHNWPGLKAVVMTEYTREIRGKIETVRRFYTPAPELA